MKQIIRLIFLLLSYTLFCNSVLADDGSDEVWLLVDTKKLQLEIKRGNKTVSVFENIAIGQQGAGFKHRIGDDITPVGSYKIGWINNKSHFHRFYGFTYPSVENAHEALLSGLLSKKSHTAIIKAHKNNQTPPQNTKIGGQIGIHGLGSADPYIHKTMNWTHGCVALTNEQVDRLAPWIKKGTRVEVK